MINHPERKSPRLLGYNYAAAGSYFVTICVQNRRSLFGHVANGILHLTPAGEMINACWQNLATKYPHVMLADHVVMPNHFHGIINIEETETINSSVSIADILSEFKTMTTRAYIHGVHESGWQPFDGKVWQRSYHDHIIRNEREMLTIQQYIAENPARWEQDKFYGVGSED